MDPTCETKPIRRSLKCQVSSLKPEGPASLRAAGPGANYAKRTQFRARREPRHSSAPIRRRLRKTKPIRRSRPSEGIARGQLCETKPISRAGGKTQEVGRPTPNPRRAAPRCHCRARRTNKANGRGDCAKRSQFPAKPSTPNKPNLGRRASAQNEPNLPGRATIRNEANFRRAGYPTIPLLYHSTIPIPPRPDGTGPQGRGTGAIVQNEPNFPIADCGLGTERRRDALWGLPAQGAVAQTNPIGRSELCKTNPI